MVTATTSMRRSMKPIPNNNCKHSVMNRLRLTNHLSQISRALTLWKKLLNISAIYSDGPMQTKACGRLVSLSPNRDEERHKCRCNHKSKKLST